MNPETIRWRRVDRPGHETATLRASSSGWHLSGTAAFVEGEKTCRFEYVIVCDLAWQTESTRVSGSVDKQAVEVQVVVDSARRWRLNGRDCDAVEGCTDVDLAFSPVTNLLPIRRLNLRPGESARVRTAWLRFPELVLEPLDQMYRRIDPTTYRYESRAGAFIALLRTNATGFVTSYPGLWEADPAAE